MKVNSRPVCPSAHPPLRSLPGDANVPRKLAIPMSNPLSRVTRVASRTRVAQQLVKEPWWTELGPLRPRLEAYYQSQLLCQSPTRYVVVAGGFGGLVTELVPQIHRPWTSIRRDTAS